MASRREQIISSIIATIEAALTIPVARSPVDPVGREVDAVCVVNWSRQQTERSDSYYDNHSVLVNVGMLCKSPQAELNADERLVTIDTAIHADLTLGGLAIDILPVGAVVQREEADQPITVITHQYRIDFRTRQGDLTQ